MGAQNIFILCRYVDLMSPQYITENMKVNCHSYIQKKITRCVNLNYNVTRTTEFLFLYFMN